MWQILVFHLNLRTGASSPQPGREPLPGPGLRAGRMLVAWNGADHGRDPTFPGVQGGRPGRRKAEKNTCMIANRWCLFRSYYGHIKRNLFMFQDPPWCGLNILRHSAPALGNGGPGKEKPQGIWGGHGGRECRERTWPSYNLVLAQPCED